MSRLLLIENNGASRRLIGDELRQLGHDVLEAKTTDEGVALALAVSFDLIIMNIQSPGSEDLTATRLLRSREETRFVPILATTPTGSRLEEARFVDAGCSVCTSRPATFGDFVRVIETMLKKNSFENATDSG